MYTTSKTTAASVAERELRALLGNRQRKHLSIINPVSTTLGLPSSFPPNSIDSLLESEWESFIKSNHTTQLSYSMYLILMQVFINYLQYYTWTFYFKMSVTLTRYVQFTQTQKMANYGLKYTYVI